MSDIIFLVLLFLHIGAVVLWMGAAVLSVSILGPMMSKLSGPTKMEFMKIIGPAFERYNIRNATIAIAAGIALYAYITQVATSLAPTPSQLPWLNAGVLLALVAYIIGWALIRPTNHKLWKIMSQSTPVQGSTGPAPEAVALQRRLMAGSGIQALLLLATLLFMVLGAQL